MSKPIMASTVFFLIVVALGTFSSACKVPPDFWCDSIEIANECGVTKQCQTLRESNSKPVNVGLYYETMCPGCIDFINKQLTPTFQKVGSIMNITLVPYGNAQTHTNASVAGGKSFECQHGVEECIGNMIETCAIYYYPDQYVHLPFVRCIAGSLSFPKLSAMECAKEHGLNYTKIKQCIDPSNPLGVHLKDEMGKRTDALQPQHTCTPWITINDFHTPDIQYKASTDLLDLVCSTYTGSPKPQACTKSPPFRVSTKN